MRIIAAAYASVEAREAWCIDTSTLSDIAVNLVPRVYLAGVRLVPEWTAVVREMSGGRLHFNVPRLHGHQMVEIFYA